MAGKIAVWARVLGIGLFASLALAQLQPGVSHAAPAEMRTYTNPAQSYALGYPIAWPHLLAPAAGGFEVRSPDGTAALRHRRVHFVAGTIETPQSATGRPAATQVIGSRPSMRHR